MFNVFEQGLTLSTTQVGSCPYSQTILDITWHYTHQGTLTEGEGSVQLTSLVLTSLDQLFLIMQTLFTFYKMSCYLNEEVNRTEPSPSVSAPCTHTLAYLDSEPRVKKVFITLATGR
jgi:hypothetical protein